MSEIYREIGNLHTLIAKLSTKIDMQNESIEFLKHRIADLSGEMEFNRLTERSKVFKMDFDVNNIPIDKKYLGNSPFQSTNTRW